jgi:hypothetical protein
VCLQVDEEMRTLLANLKELVAAEAAAKAGKKAKKKKGGKKGGGKKGAAGKKAKGGKGKKKKDPTVCRLRLRERCKPLWPLCCSAPLLGAASGIRATVICCSICTPLPPLTLPLLAAAGDRNHFIWDNAGRLTAPWNPCLLSWPATACW